MSENRLAWDQYFAAQALLIANRSTCTPKGVMTLLETYGVELRGKKVVIVGVEITDRDVASHMEHVFSVDEGNTVELTAEAWLRRPWWKKFAESLLSPWRPLF